MFWILSVILQPRAASGCTENGSVRACIVEISAHTHSADPEPFFVVRCSCSLIFDPELKCFGY